MLRCPTLSMKVCKILIIILSQKYYMSLFCNLLEIIHGPCNKSYYIKVLPWYGLTQTSFFWKLRLTFMSSPFFSNHGCRQTWPQGPDPRGGQVGSQAWFFLGGVRGVNFFVTKCGKNGGFANFFDDRGFLVDPPPLWACLVVDIEIVLALRWSRSTKAWWVDCYHSYLTPVLSRILVEHFAEISPNSTWINIKNLLTTNTLH